MIHLLSRVSIPPEAALESFRDIDSWPQWMPGLQKLEIRERHEDRFVVFAVQRQMGLTWSQLQEISITPEGLRQRQLEGNLRRWDADWRFLRPPDGNGTTISLKVDFDLGFLGTFFPGRALQRSLDNLFEKVVQEIERRGMTPEVVQAAEPKTFLRVVRTLRGLEVEIAGERYLLRSSR